MTDAKRQPTTRHFFQRAWFRWTVGILIAIIVAVPLAFNVSARPGALLIKTVFERGADTTREEMARHAPTSGITMLANETYRPNDSDAKLDVFFPETVQEGERLPLLIWTHGGAWISGDKTDNTPYYTIFANEGFTVISLNYSLGPHKTYPTQIHQINDALTYIQENAERFHVDPNRIVMAGDSAGAQLTSQIAAIVTNPDFAAEVGITPAIQPEQLRGVILNCGIYDMPAFVARDSSLEPKLADLLVWGVHTSVWAYTGDRNNDSDATQQMSTISHVTADFPATWISGGNGDQLTNAQSKPFAETLTTLGVPVTTVFYADDHEPKLAHEYQFHLDLQDAQDATASMIAFLKDRTQS